MLKSREVNAADVCRELKNLCSSWELFQHGVFSQGCDNAIEHARCLFVLLGNPLDSAAIVATTGRSLTTKYLKELVHHLPWQTAVLGAGSFEYEIPDTSDLRRWLDLIEKSERGELPVADKAESDSLWTAAEESEARRLVNAGTVTTATRLRELLSMNQAASQALFRHINGKAKKVHRRG